MHKLQFSILLCLGAVFVLYLLGQCSDYTTDIVFSKVYRTIVHTDMLDPSGVPLSMLDGAQPIVYHHAHGSLQVADGMYVTNGRCQVDLAIDRSRYAIVVAHGAICVPADCTAMIQALSRRFNCDVYAPLLAYHGKQMRDMTHVRLAELKRKLQADIEYVLRCGYDKVLCIGHSFSGALLAELSLDNAFQHNNRRVNLLLYAPSIKIKLHWLRRYLGLYPLRYIKRYLTLPIELKYNTPDLQKRRFFHFYSRSLGLAIYSLSKSLQDRILHRHDTFHNDIGILLMRDDRVVPFLDSYLLLGKQYNTLDHGKQFCRVLENGGHSIHATDDPNMATEFLSAIEWLAGQLNTLDLAD